MPLQAWGHGQYWAGTGEPAPPVEPLELTFHDRDLALSFMERDIDLTFNNRSVNLTLPDKRE